VIEILNELGKVKNENSKTTYIRHSANNITALSRRMPCLPPRTICYAQSHSAHYLVCTVSLRSLSGMHSLTLCICYAQSHSAHYLVRTVSLHALSGTHSLTPHTWYAQFPCAHYQVRTIFLLTLFSMYGLIPCTI
jgi:hypothetical protein